jgi:hypothetical protein
VNKVLLFLLALIFLSLQLYATVWQVGPSHSYTMPSQVSTLVQNADTVDIDAGTYPSDVCHWQAHNLLLRGVGGLAHLESNGLSWGDKAIWVIQGNNNRVEWIEFSECTSTSQNGAGIRYEGLNLTVSHCYFHDNEDGILGGAFHPCTVLIEFSEFAYNGYGDGFSHNLYIGNIDTLIFRYNYSHHCSVGHELKSRAYVNYILYNRLSNEASGTASREIDLPNGGLAIIMGNIIQQGLNGQNSNLVGYGLEGLSNPTPHNLYLVNNTLANEKPVGNFVNVSSGTNIYKGYNNIFAGAGSFLSGASATLDTAGNKIYPVISSAGFVNSAVYDYHLLASSTAINTGTNAGTASNGFSLTPISEYLHPANYTARNISGNIDAGAYEYNSSTGIISEIKEGDIRFFVIDKMLYVNSAQRISSLKIFDMNGRMILNKSVSSFYDCIDASPVRQGVYLIVVEFGNEKRKTIKLKF